MKALVLAAGKGSRLGNITNGAPKSLLPFGDQTLLGHSLKQFEDQGITELVIVTGFERQKIIDYVESHWSGSVEFVYNPHYDNTNVLYSFWLALPYLRDSDFVFLHADTVFSDAVLSQLLTAGPEHKMCFAIERHACQDEEMKVSLDGNHIREITKSMAWDDADGEFLGLAYIRADQLARLRYHCEQLFEEGAFQSFFEMAVQRMITQDQLPVAICDITGESWQEIDFLEDYETAKSLFFSSETNA